MSSGGMSHEQTGFIPLNPCEEEERLHQNLSTSSAKTQKLSSSGGSSGGGSTNMLSFQQQLQRRKRPRRLIIPTSKDDFEQNVIHQNAYECDGKSLLESTLWKIPRPLPTMTSMATTQPVSDAFTTTNNSSRRLETKKYVERGLSMPLLRPYLKNLEQNGHCLKTATDDSDVESLITNNETQSTSTNIVDEMDDPSSSTLTRGQQKRYKELQSEKQTGNKVWNEIKRKEYKRLKIAVQEEQALYQQAVNHFFERNQGRFLVGFGGGGIANQRATAFALVQSSYIQHYRTQWEISKCPTKFGACRQAISLQGVVLPQGTSTAAGRPNRSSSLVKLTLEDLSSEIIHTENTGTKGSLPQAQLNVFEKSDYVLSPSALKKVTFSSITLLRNDPVALRLAKDYQVNIVTTVETLHSLLQIPGDVSTSWSIPLQSIGIEGGNISVQRQGIKPTSRRRNMSKADLVILDLPIPQPSTPRYCLGLGFQEGLYQAAANSSSSSPSDSSECQPLYQGNVEYVYTLLTLPNLGRPRQHQNKCRVLVRSTNRLMEAHSQVMEQQSQSKPVRIHAQLEYFPERGWEEFTSLQKSMWILDKVLQPNAKVMVGRVCPQTARVLRFEEVSVAQALAGEESSVGSGNNIVSTATTQLQWQVVDPMHHLQAMIELLHGLEAIEQGEQLLCLPGRNLPSSSSATRSVSVHRVDHKSMLIDLQEALKDADAVYRGTEFIRQCFPRWIWEAERIPFTFPIKDEESSRTIH